jgi:hypothetical protein
MANKTDNIKKLDDALLFGGSLLDEIKLPFVLVCGTLLGVIREGQLLDHDHDVDVAVFVDDMTDDMRGCLRNNAEFGHDQESHSGKGQLDLIHNGIHFDIFFIHKKNGKSFFNPIGEECMIWDDDVFDKSKWKKARYLGREWNIPAKPIKFFNTYFGKDWKIPIQKFQWRKAPNYGLLENI